MHACLAWLDAQPWNFLKPLEQGVTTMLIEASLPSDMAVICASLDESASAS
jgi:hypothetical protein